MLVSKILSPPYLKVLFDSPQAHTDATPKPNLTLPDYSRVTTPCILLYRRFHAVHHPTPPRPSYISANNSFTWLIVASGLGNALSQS
jgi:hypothetical protein